MSVRQYLITIGTKNFSEKYSRDKDGWFKISAKGNKFRMTSEQVLNHLLPVISGLKPNLKCNVEYKHPEELGSLKENKENKESKENIIK